MIKTEYGLIEKSKAKEYLDKLIGRVFQIIYLKEEGCKTIDKYISSLCRELVGSSTLYLDKEFLAIVGTLKGMDISSHSLIKTDVYKIISLINMGKKRLENGD